MPPKSETQNLHAADQARAKARYEAALAALPKDEPLLDFKGEVRLYGTNSGMHYIRVPGNVDELYGKTGFVRCHMRVGDIYLDRSLYPTGQHEDLETGTTHIVALSKSVVRQLALRPGDEVHIQCFRNLNEDDVDVPAELLEALEVDALAKARWQWLSASLRRSHSHYVSSGKHLETRAKRAVDVFGWLMEPTATRASTALRSKSKGVDWPANLGGFADN